MCSDAGDVDFDNFTLAMKRQLYLYTLRQVNLHPQL